MSEREENDGVLYRVVMNEEEQYSIWPASKQMPLGWSEAGPQADKQQCLDYIKRVWTDMRPLSLRKQMEKSDIGELH